MIVWCIDVLNEVCNDVKVWSRHSIFRKENTVLILLLGCIDLWVSCEWDDPDSTNIIESHRWSYSVGKSWWRFIWFCLGFEIEPGLSGHMNLPCHMKMMRYLDNYAHGCVGFTTVRCRSLDANFNTRVFRK